MGMHQAVDLLGPRDKTLCCLIHGSIDEQCSPSMITQSQTCHKSPHNAIWLLPSPPPERLKSSISVKSTLKSDSPSSFCLSEWGSLYFITETWDIELIWLHYTDPDSHWPSLYAKRMALAAITPPGGTVNCPTCSIVLIWPHSMYGLNWVGNLPTQVVSLMSGTGSPVRPSGDSHRLIGWFCIWVCIGHLEAELDGMESSQIWIHYVKWSLCPLGVWPIYKASLRWEVCGADDLVPEW